MIYYLLSIEIIIKYLKLSIYLDINNQVHHLKRDFSVMGQGLNVPF